MNKRIIAPQALRDLRDFPLSYSLSLVFVFLTLNDGKRKRNKNNAKSRRWKWIIHCRDSSYPNIFTSADSVSNLMFHDAIDYEKLCREEAERKLLLYEYLKT